MKNILIVKSSSGGDILQSLHVVNFLKNILPEVSIDWVVEKQCDFLKNFQGIDNVIVMDTYKWRKIKNSGDNLHKICSFIATLRQKVYDLVVDLQGNFKSAIVDILSRKLFSIGFGWNYSPEKINTLFTGKHYNPPEGRNIRCDYLYPFQQYFDNYFDNVYSDFRFAINNENIHYVDDLIATIKGNDNRIILIAPHSRWKSKMMSLTFWKEFAGHVVENGFQCLCIYGDENEKQFANNLSGISGVSTIKKINVETLKYVMENVNAIIGVDSFPLHLGGLTNTPTMGIFGPSLGSKYNPPQGRFIQCSCPLKLHFNKRCPLIKSCPGKCMATINGTYAAKQFIEFLS